MTLLQEANQALRDQRYDAALGLYMQLLQEGSVPTSAVHPSLRILQSRLQCLRDPAQQAKLQQISAALAPTPTPALADQAAQARDWVLAAQRWEQILRQPNPALDAGSLVQASQALFKADNFPLAHQALQQALAKAPEHAGAKREHKNQYYYHAYSNWLMKTTEGRSDWYKADGLSERPNWKTAVDLCRPYIDKPRGAVAPHDLRQWTQAGLLWAEEHLDRQDHVRATAILRETMAPLTAACPPELTKALIETIETARAKPGADLSAPSKRLEQALSTLDSDTLRVPEWLCIFDMLNWNGLLQLGNLARQHAIQRAMRQADAEGADVASLQQGVCAALEQGELERAGRYLARLPTAAQKTARAAELRAVHALFSGHLEAFRKEWPHTPRPVDQRFREYLRGKSVAVVGPAPTESTDGAEIDSFDVVARINWRGIESLKELDEFGQHTNISLHNAHTARLFPIKKQLVIVKKLDYLLTRRPNLVHSLQSPQASKIRIISEYPASFYKSLNSVPAVVFDLLLHGADNIKVFKINFYLSERHHFEAYRDCSNQGFSRLPLRNLQPVLANHQLTTQRSLLAILDHHSFITLDNTAKQIASENTDTAYLERLSLLIRTQAATEAKSPDLRKDSSNLINRSIHINGRRHRKPGLINTCQPVALVLNGPSASRYSAEDFSSNAVIARCNFFHQEEAARYGRDVDFYFWSLNNSVLNSDISNILHTREYNIKNLCSCVPKYLLEFTDSAICCLSLLDREIIDHWKVIMQNQELGRFLASRPLPTTGTQALAFFAVLGFRSFEVIGMDFYQGTKRYMYTPTPQMTKNMEQKHFKPGYEKGAHSLELDTSFLIEVLRQYPDIEIKNISNNGVMEQIRSGKLPKSISYDNLSRFSI